MDGECSSHDELESILQDATEPCSLLLEDLKKITNNFSDNRLLGEGGFGRVYKGVLQNGEIIAVKKLAPSSPEIQARLFDNEARHLMRLKHQNIVQLVGFCCETEIVLVELNGKHVCAEKSEMLLCLEYMPKGSLLGHLSDEASGHDWDTRYKIIEGICYGLHYLHEEWKVNMVNAPIIHMDLKPANILLDNNMVPKIADFGLSRLFTEEKTWIRTKSRDGTLGYMAPEYINKGTISKKSDIFSVGVIIIEIITGYRDYPDEPEISSQKFIELVLMNWRNRLEKEPWLYAEQEKVCQQIRRCIQVGLACVRKDRAKRPTITQVIDMLHGLECEEYSCGRKNCSESEAAMSQENQVMSDPNELLEIMHHAGKGSESPSRSKNKCSSLDLGGEGSTIDVLVCCLYSTSLDEQKYAVGEIISLAKNEDNHAKLGVSGAIPPLVKLLSAKDLKIQELAVTALMLISIYGSNKVLIALADAIVPIIQVMRTGSMDASRKAAGAIYSLSLNDDNKIVIGRTPGAFEALVKLLQCGSSPVIKQAAMALCCLCVYEPNRIRALQAGIMAPLVQMLQDSSRKGAISKAVAILALLVGHQECKVAMSKAHAIPLLVDLLRSDRASDNENAAIILHALCKEDAENIVCIERLGALIPLTELAKTRADAVKNEITSLMVLLGTLHVS